VPSVDTSAIVQVHPLILLRFHVLDHLLLLVLRLARFRKWVALGIILKDYIDILRVHLELLEVGEERLVIEKLVLLGKAVIQHLDVVVRNDLGINLKFLNDTLESAEVDVTLKVMSSDLPFTTNLPAGTTSPALAFCS
jgi:hypothetical protein